MAALSSLKFPTPKFPVTEPLLRIRAEYLEMPSLNLTTLQARRLWGLDCATCDGALPALVDAKFLSRTQKDLFVVAGNTTFRSKASHWFGHD